jgi:hypothetical protein
MYSMAKRFATDNRTRNAWRNSLASGPVSRPFEGQP